MKPDLARFIGVAAGHLMTQTASAIGTSYEQANVTALGAMLISVGEEFERAAARRSEENHALRGLFEQAAPVVTDSGLRERLERAAAGEETSLRVSDLERANAELRALLIELHVHVEELDSPAARQIESAIWQELVASTERRKLMMGPF